MKARFFFAAYFFVFLVFVNKAQDPQLDSLKHALSVVKQDTTRCIILIQLAETASDEEWPLFNDTLCSLCEKKLKTLPESNPLHKKFLAYYATSLNNKGFLANQKGKQIEALEYYSASIKIQEKIGDKQGLAASCNNIGYIHKSQGNIPLAIDFYIRSMKLLEQIRLPDGEIEDKKGLAYAYSNLGVIYKDNGDLNKALSFNDKALKLREQVNDKSGIGQSLNNLGFIYIEFKEIDKALLCFEKALKLREEAGYKNDIANSLHNLAYTYERKGDQEKALEYYNRCIKMQEVINDKNGLSYSYNNMAAIYLKQNKLKQALEYSLKGMAFAKDLGGPANISNAAKVLSRIYKEKGEGKAALDMFKLYVAMHDSVNNEITRKASIKSQLKYEYDKKAAADSVRVSEERKMVEVQLKQEKTQRYTLSGGLILVVLFSLFMVNRFRVTNKQKKIIEEQKKVVEAQKNTVEVKQKEVLDSIHYARRIQLSLLPQEKYIGKVLNGRSKK